MPDKKNTGPLAGRRVLIVEDEMLVAMDLQEQLETEGCIIIGPVANVKSALEVLSEHHPDVATLDLNLNGETSAAIANALTEMSVPFLLTTGYSEEQIDDQFPKAPWVNKPVNMAELLEKLVALLK